MDGYQAYGLNPDRELGGTQHGPNVAIGFSHDKQTIHDNIVYEPANANFKTIINIWSDSIANKQFYGIIGHALMNVGCRPAEKSWVQLDRDEECVDFVWDKRVDFAMDTKEGLALLR